MTASRKTVLALAAILASSGPLRAQAYTPICLTPTQQTTILTSAASLAPLVGVDLTDFLMRYADQVCSAQATVTAALANLQQLNQQIIPLAPLPAQLAADEANIATLQAQVKALQGGTPPPPPPSTCPAGQLCIVTQPVSVTISLSAPPLPGLLVGQAQFSTTVSAVGCRTIIHTNNVNSYGPQQTGATWTYTTPVLTAAQSGTVYRQEMYGCTGVSGDVISNPVVVTVTP